MTGPLPLLLSGASSTSLAGTALALADLLDSGASVRDVGSSLLAQPPRGPHRAVVLASPSPTSAARSLRKLAHRVPSAEVITSPSLSPDEPTARRLGFVFPGQGSHRAGMCGDLHERFPVYAEAFEGVAEHFAPLLDIPMREVVLKGAGLERPRYAHAAMFVVEYALTVLLADFGVRPDVVGGYSGGEDVSACVAGMVELRDMCELIVARAIAIEELAPPGGMLAVQAGLAEVEAVLPENVHVAGINGPSAVVVAGPDADLDQVAERFERSRRVRVDNPFHTPHLRSTVDRFVGGLEDIPCAEPRLPFVSSVTGDLVHEPLDVVDHWGKHFEQPVRFAEVVERMRELGVTTFLEVGPGGTLTTMVRGITTAQAVPLLHKNFRDDEAMLNALAQLHVAGHDVDFSSLFADAEVIELPETGEAPEALDDPATIVDGHVAAVLGLPELSTEHRTRTFLDLGLDSVTAVELRHRLATATGRDLPLTVVFDHPTPAELAQHLSQDEPDDTEETPEAAEGDPVVIVGMACRLPGGADTPDALWNLLLDGTDAITDAPSHRGWQGEWRGGFLADAGDFDAAFFGISPDDALTMDPQQRLLLETTWAALEDTGIDPSTAKGKDIGVFMGGMVADYGPRLLDTAAVPASLTGTLGSVLSGRISYALGLNGPALTVDTACSSSLVALHLAATAIRAGECALAVAGGATVMPDPGVLAEFARQGGLAEDGRCKAFADTADGTVFAEGAGVLVLTRESTARRAGHRVLAVVRGSAVNSDGASNGLTAPNGRAQRRVIRQALRRAGLRPSDVDAVEAHGTGTKLGDPIEAHAVLATYGQSRPHPLHLGSLKSNIGHTQAAAGVAGVIKVIMAMRHGVLPATLHADPPSTALTWDTVQLTRTTSPWPETGRPRRAGVSSFGISGTNAHVILEQGDTTPSEHRHPDRTVPWAFSARTEKALRAKAKQLADLTADPLDVGASLITTRTAFEHRAVVLAADDRARRRALEALAAGEAAPGAVQGRTVNGSLAVVFAGQGGQRPGMGSVLRERFPAFAVAWDEVMSHLPDLTGDPQATGTAQPALFALEVALFRLIESWGVRPDFVAGHSVGEIAAAHVAGVLSLADAARLAAERGRLMQRLPSGGAMVAVEAAEDIELPPDVVIAAINGPRAVVVAGPERPVLAFLNDCAARGLRAKRLRVSHAFHSPLMDPVLADLEKVVADLTFRPARLPVISTVTGKRVDAELAEPRYWSDHARNPVRFAHAVETLRAEGVGTFLEAGPDRSLSALIGSDAVPLLHKDNDEELAALSALAELHVRGVAVDFGTLLDGGRPTRLPTYPFDRKTFWLDSSGAASRPATTTDPGLREQLAECEDAQELVLSVVRRELGFVLGDASGVEADRPFTETGMDSLAAVRLRDRLTAATGVTLPATAAYDCPTPAALAAYLVGLLLPERRTPGGEVLRRLDLVAGDLPAVVDRADRARVKARLRVLLDQLEPTAGESAEDLSAASNEELFALIDREFEDL
ncbi:acyltransferase domain-containing protein [Allokutzneria oryzae]|uniref:Acyltransferase domain-containing protein n=1 Tax=Allokutzneria oryzae TaxID=1378989 RepID=A0ABV5ZVD5_9PSEU